MNARDHLSAVLAAISNWVDTGASDTLTGEVVHNARNFLAVPDRTLVDIMSEMVTRLDTLHPSRRGVKRNACALDMVTGAAIATHHCGSDAVYAFTHLAFVVAVRGADELDHQLKVKL